jgi:hypothetical protein
MNVLILALALALVCDGAVGVVHLVRRAVR